MRKHLGLITLAALVVLALLASTVAYTVDELKDIVLVKRFGEVVRVQRGAEANQAGLAFKWPWPIERLVRFDSRWFIFEDPYQESLTRDKQNILVSMYCTWRIRQPRDFLRQVETVDVARERIRDRLRTRKGGVISTHPMVDLINTDPGAMQMRQIEQEIHEQLKGDVEKTYGVEIGMVQIKVWGLSEAVSRAVIDTQKKEREQYVQEYKAKGESQANTIRELALSARTQILEFTERKAADIRTEGTLAAAELYKQFSANPELGMFLITLEEFEKELQGRSVIVLDASQHPAIKFLRDGPSLSVFAPTTQAATQPAGER